MTLLGFEIKDGESSGTVTEDEHAYRVLEYMNGTGTHCNAQVTGSARFDTGTASRISRFNTPSRQRFDTAVPHLVSSDSTKSEGGQERISLRAWGSGEWFVSVCVFCR